MKKKVLVLGSTGMLGIEVLRELLNRNIDLYATIRSSSDKIKIKKYLNSDISKIKFYNLDIKGSYKSKLKKIVSKKNFVVNCIGIIKPYIVDNDVKSLQNALNVNSIFPHILKTCVKKDVKVFQIATDCVYDGAKGKYKEDDSHNAKDVYGKSKSLGEVQSENFFNIRCSIIGNEIKGFKSLLCWFLNQKKNSKIFGFRNHLWNGITTRHFGKIISVLILKEIKIPNNFHIMPGDVVNKFQMLKIFQKKFNRFDLKITKTNANIVVNRTIKSNYMDINKEINKSLGLKKSPTIKQMINEII
jgi:dTDP-4-dehydrorhamnose reductase